MFTGIIREVGVVREALPEGGKRRIRVEGAATAALLAVNDSIAIDGVCQTVVEKSGDMFDVEAVEETLGKTTLGEFICGRKVNLEPSMRLGDRLGGHLVLGHVDCTGVTRRLERLSGSWLMHVEFPREYGRYLTPVGSIAVDGVSLTVARLGEGMFTVAVIPHTLEHTTMGGYEEGRRVNLEFDLLGKYVERLLQGRKEGEPGLSREDLERWGYRT